jgi:hypothetical protein
MRGFDIQFWFDLKDEHAFSLAVRSEFPEVVFLDSTREFTPTPNLLTSLRSCQAQWIEIWNPSIYPTWPSAKVQKGKVQGPDFLVFHRSRYMSYATSSGDSIEVLTSGSVGWGGGDPRLEGRAEMHAFAQRVMDLTESMHTDTLVPLGDPIERVPKGGVKGYVVGPSASRWCRSGSNRAFKVNSASHLYVTTLHTDSR